MILYNTAMGICAGLSLILVPVLGSKIYRRQKISAEGWSLTFAAIGLVLTVLSGLMATTWPLTVNPPINIAFAEPNLFLGVLMLAASLLLWQHRDIINTLGEEKSTASLVAEARLTRALTPLAYVVFTLGLILAAVALAIFRFNLVGSAPAAEPISGLLHDYPVVENSFFGILYSLAAIGALLAPFALKKRGVYFTVMSRVWITAGVCFLLFSVMNYYTHIGLLVNIGNHTNYRF